MSHSSIGRRRSATRGGSPGLTSCLRRPYTKLDHLVGRADPDDAAGLGAVLDQARHLEAMLGEVALHRAAVAQQGEALEHARQRCAHLLVGVEHYRAVAEAPVADGQT